MSYLPIKTLPELLKILEVEGREPKEYYFETEQEACEFFFQYAIICMFIKI